MPSSCLRLTALKQSAKVDISLYAGITILTFLRARICALLAVTMAAEEGRKRRTSVISLRGTSRAINATAVVSRVRGYIPARYLR